MNKCVKCGNEIGESSRYCLHCGALNINHPDNMKAIQFLNKSNNKVNNINNSNQTIYDKKINTMKTVIFVIVNFLLYLLFLKIGRQMSDINNIELYYIIISISYLYFVCFQLLMIKAQLPWWGLFIPVYNLYLINKLAFRNGWMFLILFISPIFIFITLLFKLYILINLFTFLTELIMFIYSLALPFCIGKRFGRSGIITILFGFIVIPTIAISKKYQYEY